MNQSKDQHLVETLSALMDGECDDLELRRLLKQLPDSASQSEVLETWRRFNVTRAAMHGEPVRNSSHASTQRILDTIALEPAHQGANQRTGAAAATMLPASTGWMNRSVVTRLAIAASVAVAVFLGMQTALTPDGTAGSGEMLAGNEKGGPGSEVAFDAEAQQRLNEYIQNVSIQYQADMPALNVFEEIPALRPVNQIELNTPDSGAQDGSAPR